MQFDSLAAALTMDGHGVYVWSVVVICIMLASWLLAAPTLAARRFLADQRGLQQLAAGDDSRAAPTAIIEEVNNAPGS